MTIGGDILLALKARLQTIRTANGYGTDVKEVRLDFATPTLNTAETDLPLIEIHDEAEEYEHGASSGYWANTMTVLYMVAPKAWTDVMMQQFLTDVRKALYGGSSNATGNTGITLGGKVSKIELLAAIGDLNMIESNRIYMLRIMLRSHRTTFSD